MNSKKYDIRKTAVLAIKNSLPVVFAYTVVGFTFGIMLSEAGYTGLHAFLAGLFVYSGSLQLAMVPLMAARAPLYVIAASALLINSRYMFYGLGYTGRFRRQGILYPYMIFAFPDEVYGIFSGMPYPEDVDADKCDLWTALICHASWTLGCLLGAVSGSILPFDLSGIDFAATALFACIVIDRLRSPGSVIPVLTGLICGAACLFLLGPDRFILPALTASLIALLIIRSHTVPDAGGSDVEGGCKNE